MNYELLNYVFFSILPLFLVRYVQIFPIAHPAFGFCSSVRNSNGLLTGIKVVILYVGTLDLYVGLFVQYEPTGCTIYLQFHHHQLPPWVRSFDLFRQRRVASTVSSSSRFVVQGVFRESGVFHSFKMVDPVLFMFGSHVLHSIDP